MFYSFYTAATVQLLRVVLFIRLWLCLMLGRDGEELVPVVSSHPRLSLTGVEDCTMLERERGVSEWWAALRPSSCRPFPEMRRIGTRPTATGTPSRQVRNVRSFTPDQIVGTDMIGRDRNRVVWLTMQTANHTWQVKVNQVTMMIAMVKAVQYWWGRGRS